MIFRRTSGRATTMSLFKEEPSLLLRTAVFSVLAICLMVGDARFHLTPLIRQSVAFVIAPLEWAAAQPVRWWRNAHGYFVNLEQARMEEDAARVRLAQQSLRAALVENLMLENERLRLMLKLRDQSELDGRAAEVLYEAPDPYSQRLIVDRGLLQGIVEGSPVLDDQGVMGQVTRVLPLTSEVTLLTNERFTVSVTNARTGMFGVVYGDPSSTAWAGAPSVELRFIKPNADIKEGDLLISSGIDGVYPVGLPVARVLRIEHNRAAKFLRIWCLPVARIHNTRYVMIVKPSSQLMQESEQLEKEPSSAVVSEAARELHSQEGEND